MNWDETLVIFGAAILVLSWSPQAVKIIKNRSSKDVSLTFLLTILAGTLLLIPHSYMIEDWYFTAMNTCAAIAQMTVIILVLKYND